MPQINQCILALMQVPRLGAKSIALLFEHLSLEELLTQDETFFRQIGWAEDQIKAWFQPNEKRIEKALRWGEIENHHLISLLDEDYPYLLKQIPSPPSMLFVKGNVPLLHAPQLAMVGSRYCSSYGEYWAKYFATELTLAGFHITSGMALGIDGFSHQAVVDIKGQTLAVLGCGLNHVYPKRHRKLMEKILENRGSVISEFFPEQPPIAQHFPQRNRIISGLSQGTLVIEATEKSGSLITARYALEQNREIFALPGSIQNQFSRGCHHLIRQGATLVEEVNDILEVLSPYEFPQPLPPTPKTTPPPSTPQETPSYPELYQLLDHQGLSLDELSERSGLGVETLLIQLLELELQNLITQDQGRYRRV